MQRESMIYYFKFSVIRECSMRSRFIGYAIFIYPPSGYLGVLPILKRVFFLSDQIFSNAEQTTSSKMDQIISSNMKMIISSKYVDNHLSKCIFSKKLSDGLEYFQKENFPIIKLLILSSSSSALFTQSKNNLDICILYRPFNRDPVHK